MNYTAPPPPGQSKYPHDVPAPPQPQPPPSHHTFNNTVVVNSQPGSANSRLVLLRRDQLNQRDWHSGLCGCLNDVCGCLLGTLCMPIMMCRLANRMDECALLACCVPGAFVTLRTKLRVMGGIQGSICSDCITTTCCGPCAACQMSREMDVMQM